nr:twin-arginine translocation signal domain-containing protein [Pseudomonadota bacterium]
MLNLDRRQFLLGAAAAGALGLSGCQSWRPQSASARALRLYDQIFIGMLEAAPEMATSLGLDTGARAHLKYRLSDASAAGKMGAYRPLIEALPRLRAIDREALPPQERAWLDTVTWVGERIAVFEPVPYGSVGGYNYPVPYVITQLTGSYQDVPDFLDSQHKIETVDDAEAY